MTTWQLPFPTRAGELWYPGPENPGPWWWLAQKYLDTYTDLGAHTGLDGNKGFGNQDRGEPVEAIGDGEVEAIGGSWGIVLTRHESRLVGTFWDRAGHCEAIQVQVGQKVKRGQVLALTGRTGTEWAHVHRDFPRTALPYPTYYNPGKTASNVRTYYYDPEFLFEQLLIENEGDQMFRGGARIAGGRLGAKDVIVTGAGPGMAPTVRIWDMNGKILFEFDAFDPSFEGGVFVAVATDRVLVGADSGGGAHVKVFRIDLAAKKTERKASFKAY